MIFTDLMCYKEVKGCMAVADTSSYSIEVWLMCLSTVI
jgi:hypothetical protein